MDNNKDTMGTSGTVCSTIMTKEMTEKVISPIEENLKEKSGIESVAFEPNVIGNDQVAILKHDLYRKECNGNTDSFYINMTIKNICETTIGSILFEAEFNDSKGNLLDKVEKNTTDLRPNTVRKINIDYSTPKSDEVSNYSVRVIRVSMTPKPEVIGNERIKILNHGFNRMSDDENGELLIGVFISLRNTSDITIATIVFEVVFYDIEGNVLDTIKHKEIELKPDISRRININYVKQYNTQPKSYRIKINRMTMSDTEKYQLRRHDMRTTTSGEVEVRGTLKNISNCNTNAALAATFFNHQNETIGTKVIILRDIEPNNIRQFNLVFKPIQERVKSYTLDVGDLIE